MSAPPREHVEVRAFAQADIDEFAAAMGAEGRIHVDVEWATRHHGGTVVPGVLVFAPAIALAQRVFGQRWDTHGRVELRFRRPTRAGERVTTTCRLRADGLGYAVRCAGEDGEVRVQGEVRCKSASA